MSRKGDVGYRRPPKHTRFKRGQSGNPKGRPRGSKNLKTLLAEELRTPITLRDGGAGRRIVKAQAVVMSLIARSLKGDSRATATIFQLADSAEAEEVAEAHDFSVTDLALIERALERRRATSKKTQDNDGKK